jgi:hypothetical protein
VDDGFRVGEFTGPLAAAAARGAEVFAVADGTQISAMRRSPA